MRALFAYLLLAPSLVYAQEPVEPGAPPPPEPSPREQCLAHRKELAAQAQATADLNERTRLLRNLPDCGDATPPPTSSVVGSGLVAEAPDTIATGFAIEARLDTVYSVISDAFVPSMQPGIFVGYRGSAFSAGLGLEIARVAQSASSGSVEMSSSTTAFLVVPGVRVRLARTAEGDTELLAAFDAGIGTTVTSDDDPDDDPASPVRLHFQLGLSPRHWFTRSFAIGAAIGLRYDIGLISTELNGVTVDQSASALSLFSSLQIISVF
jgi:hypothetical protein